MSNESESSRGGQWLGLVAIMSVLAVVCSLILPGPALAESDVHASGKETDRSGSWSTRPMKGAQEGESEQVGAVALGVHAVAVGVARQGGFGSLEVVLPRQNPDPEIRGLELRLQGVDGVTISGESSGWSCYRDRWDWVCSHADRLQPEQVAEPLQARVEVAESMPAEELPLRVEASWEVSADGRWISESLGNDARVLVLPALELKVSGGTGGVLPVRDGGEAAGWVTAHVDGAQGQQVDVKWEQVAGPPVTALDALEQEDVGDRSTLRYEVSPEILDGEKLSFRARAVSNGSAVAQVVDVRVDRSAEGTFAPKMQDYVLLAEDSAKAKQPALVRSQLLPKETGRLNGSGVTQVRTYKYKRVKKCKGKSGKQRGRCVKRVKQCKRAAEGAKAKSECKYRIKRVRTVVKLRLRGLSGVESTSWQVSEGKPGLLRKARTSDQAIKFKAPRRGTSRVTATVQFRDGSSRSFSEIIVVKPRKPKKVRHQDTGGVKRSSASAEVSAAASDKDEYCALMEELQTADTTVSFPDGSKLSLVQDAAATCEDSNGFKGARLSTSDFTLPKVKGQISASGVTVQAVRWDIPESLRGLFDDREEVRLEVPSSTQLSAKLGKGGWQAWQGTVKAPASWTSQLQLPAGWSTKPIELTFSKGLTVTAEAVAPAGSTGAVMFTFKSNEVAVTASDIVVFSADDGQSNFTASGEASFQPGNTPSVTLKVDCSVEICEIVDGLRVTNTSLQWSASSLRVRTSMSMGRSDPFSFTAAGEYSSPTNWRLQVTADESWALGDSGVTLSSFSGSISSALNAAQQSELTVSIQAAVQGLDVGALKDAQASAVITNECPKSGGCDTGGVRLELEASGDLSVENRSYEISFRGAVDTRSYAYQLTAAVKGQFGPQSLNLSGAQLVISSSSTPGRCSANVAGEAGQGRTVSVQATATVLGTSFEIGGDLYPDGYCVYGLMGDYQEGVFKGRDTVVAYSSFDGGATVDGVNVEARTVTLHGNVTLPDGMSQQFKGSSQDGQLSFQATLNTDQLGFQASIDYRLPGNGVYLFGDQSSNSSLQLQQVSISAAISSSQASLELSAEGTLNLKGSSPQVKIALAVSGSFSKASVSVSGEMNDWNNAFGEDDLNISNVKVEGSFEMPSFTPAFEFDTTVQFPDRWTENIKLQNSPRITLQLHVSATSPCLNFSIGDQPQDTTKPATALNIGDMGFLTASYVHLQFAPFGCTLDGKDIPAGFMFDFNGTLVGTPIDVDLAVTLPSPGNSNVAIKGNLDVGAFELAGASIKGTTLAVDIDTGTNHYEIDFSGGLALPDGVITGDVTVNGGIKVTSDQVKVMLAGNGDIKLSGISASVQGSRACPDAASTTDCIIYLEYANGKVQQVQVSAALDIRVLGLSLRAKADLQYQDGTLLEFGVSIGASLNLAVAEVSGDIMVHYCLGALTVSGSTAECAQDPNGSKRFKVKLDGFYRVAWWKKSYAVDIVDYPSDRDPAVDLNFGLVDPQDMVAIGANDYNPEVLFEHGDFAGSLVGEGRPRSLSADALKPAEVAGFDACPRDRGIGMVWDGKDGNNPNLTQRPLHPQPCGFKAVVSYLNDSVANGFVKSDVDYQKMRGQQSPYEQAKDAWLVCGDRKGTEGLFGHDFAACQLYDSREDSAQPLGLLTSWTVTDGKLTSNGVQESQPDPARAAKAAQGLTAGATVPLGILQSSTKLMVDVPLYDPSGRYFLVAQKDGNLVLYHAPFYRGPDEAVWAIDRYDSCDATTAEKTCTFTVDPGGNLKWERNGQRIWEAKNQQATVNPYLQIAPGNNGGTVAKVKGQQPLFPPSGGRSQFKLRGNNTNGCLKNASAGLFQNTPMKANANCVDDSKVWRYQYAPDKNSGSVSSGGKCMYNGNYSKARLTEVSDCAPPVSGGRSEKDKYYVMLEEGRIVNTIGGTDYYLENKNTSDDVYFEKNISGRSSRWTVIPKTNGQNIWEQS